MVFPNEIKNLKGESESERVSERVSPRIQGIMGLKVKGSVLGFKELWA
jgi:hypothetical protein